jgi:hypothetical protein
MKASVQYGDFEGTVSADISDHEDLNDFLNSRGVDTKRYEAIGASFYSSYTDFSACIICIDNEQSTIDKRHLVEIEFETEINNEEFFDLFKRFKVILTSKCHDQDIDEYITFDDRVKEDKKL